MKNAKKSSVYRHEKLKISVQIYIGTGLNNRGRFLAEYGGNVFGEETLRGLEQKLAKAVEEGESITWFPVLHIDVPEAKKSTDDFDEGDKDDEGDISHQFTLAANRFWLGRSSDGVWREVSWSVDPNARLERAREFELTRRYGRNAEAKKLEVTLPQKPMVIRANYWWRRLYGVRSGDLGVAESARREATRSPARVERPVHPRSRATNGDQEPRFDGW
jgi:hypothetical protein